MSRRRRGQSNTPLLITGLIAIIAIISISFFFFNSRHSDSNESNCGKREEDPTRNGYCLTTTADYDELVIVTGNTQNSPAPNIDFTQGKLYEIISGVFYNTERRNVPKISIVSAAGNNHIIDYKNKYKVAQNILASNNQLKNLAKEISDTLTQPPSEAGADYLGGILEAYNIISSDSQNPVIVVVGSGYSDSGILNFATDNLFDKYRNDPDSITYILEHNRQAKESILNSVDIYWYNLGDVVAPQSNMNEYKPDLQGIYQTAFEYLGTKHAYLNNYTGIANDATSVKSQYSVQQTYVNELKVGDTFSVNENIGRFHPDKDTLINPIDVEDKLSAFASRFNKNGKIKLKLTGYIAFCVGQGELGKSRADTIKNILIKLGIPGNKIETYGQPGSPSEDPNESYTCNSQLPETERRTVQIEVIKE